MKKNPEAQAHMKPLIEIAKPYFPEPMLEHAIRLRAYKLYAKQRLTFTTGSVSFRRPSSHLARCAAAILRRADGDIVCLELAIGIPPSKIPFIQASHLFSVDPAYDRMYEPAAVTALP